jgi:hypothetical protein
MIGHNLIIADELLVALQLTFRIAAGGKIALCQPILKAKLMINC